MARLVLRLLAALAAPLAAALLPAAATATECPLPGDADPTMTAVGEFQGDVPAGRAKGFLQIPFDVPAGTTAIRIRYSYDQPGGVCGGGPNTLDIGVYGPKPAGAAFWPISSSRGWSGSAVRDFAIAVNGFTDEATYEAARKAYVQGRTTRAYRPGPIPAGEWAVELGLAYIDPDDADGIHYRVRVEASSDDAWSNDPYAPSGYSDAPVSSGPGWYAGDLHVHGEQEPGNAPMSQTFDRAFKPPAAGGSGLDFVTIVDHNNAVAHDDLAGYQAANAGRLIIPGVEMTTYRGHYNNQGRAPLVDFRAGPIYAGPDAGTQVRPAIPPSHPFSEIEREGNWAQINHPTIFRNAPSLCRGCAWSYDDLETQLGRVEAIEIQTGPAGVPFPAPAAANPFTADAIAFYERALDLGHRVAAVGSSDDHQGGAATGPFDAPVGSATTVVYAEELSERAITSGVIQGRTYVKLFGNDGPDIELVAALPHRGKEMIGDSVSDSWMKPMATVSGTDRSGRPGRWRAILLRDGRPFAEAPIAGGSLTRDFGPVPSGRYALEVVRSTGGIDYVEGYTSPFWFTKNSFKVRRAKRNERRGTATVRIEVPGPGSVQLRGASLVRDAVDLPEAGTARLTVKARGKLAKRLNKRGRVRAAARFTFAPDGGELNAKRKRIRLIRR